MAAVPVTLDDSGTFAGSAVSAFAVSAGSYGVAQDGSVAVVVVPAADTDFRNVILFDGDVPLNVTPGATLSRANVWSISGSIPLSVQPAAIFEKARDFVGSNPIGLSVNAELSSAFSTLGSVNLSLIPLAGLDFSDKGLIVGDVSISLTALALLEYDRFIGIDPTIISLSGSIDESTIQGGAGIDPTITSLSGAISESMVQSGTGIDPTINNETGSIGPT